MESFNSREKKTAIKSKRQQEDFYLTISDMITDFRTMLIYKIEDNKKLYEENMDKMAEIADEREKHDIALSDLASLNMKIHEEKKVAERILRKIEEF